MQEVSNRQNQSRDLLRISQALENSAYDARFLASIMECVDLWELFESGARLSSQQEVDLSSKMVDVMTILLMKIARGSTVLTFKGGV